MIIIHTYILLFSDSRFLNLIVQFCALNNVHDTYSESHDRNITCRRAFDVSL